jgi:hypothetical protein
LDSVIIPDNIIYPKNYLDVFLSKTSPKIRKQQDLSKTKLSIGISKETESEFRKFVKKRHRGVIKGPYSYELERAMLFYLHFYDV